jgi:hypothetical protein
MATPANTPNIPINAATGYTASIATNVVGGAHYQVYKMAYGDTGSASIVSSTNPFPVILSAGVTANIVNFTNPVIVVGNSAGDPVRIQGTVSILGTTGAPLAITGGIPLNYSKDSIKIYGYNGNTFIPATLVGSGGVAVGMSGSAIRVSVQDITVTASINPVIYVQNYGSTSAIRIEGNSGGYPVVAGVSGTVTIYDTNIVNGLTGIYNQMVTLNNNFIAYGVGRPTAFVAGRMTATTGVTSLYPSGYTTGNGIQMKASALNTDLIYINSDGVASLGYELDPGESVFLDITNLNKIYIRARTSSQAISYMAS